MYSKTTWDASGQLSARNFNHLETQWTEIQTLVDAHNHDDRYYTKTESDSRFFHAGNMGLGSGFDADLLDGAHASSMMGEVLPIGAIMDWPDYSGVPPTGWHICDGTGGTVDLRNRFVIGAGGSYTVGATGGTTALIPTGALTIAPHQLTTAEIPSHAHTYYEYHNPVTCYLSEPSDWYASAQTSTARTAGNQDTGDGAHGHTGSTITFEELDIMPPYYSLFLIQKVA